MTSGGEKGNMKENIDFVANLQIPHPSMKGGWESSDNIYSKMLLLVTVKSKAGMCLELVLISGFPGWCYMDESLLLPSMDGTPVHHKFISSIIRFIPNCSRVD